MSEMVELKMTKADSSRVSAQSNGNTAQPAVDTQLWKTLRDDELKLLQELVRVLRTVTYGNVQLTIHGGRLVELSKTEKMRRS
jgi:hypothetical protein